MSISRRGLFGAGLAIGAGWAFHPLMAQDGGSSGMTTDHGDGFFRVRLGDTDIIAVSDGSARRPLDATFVRNAPLREVEAALADAGLPTDHIENPFTPFVVVTGGRTFLLDAGFGDNGPDGTGQLHDTMRAAGIDPASVSVVLMSHLHGDHVNGLRRSDGTLVYPDATLYIPQPEYDHWMDTERMNALPEDRQGGFRTVQRVLADYPEDRLVLFTPGDRIEDTFDSIPAFGHSPGHTAYSVGEGEDSFTFIGDAAHFPPLFVRNPDWQVQFDMDPDAARQSRHEILSRVSDGGGLVGGYHFPQPSLGRMAAADTGYAFTPEG
jgi:glyoxylase-like metal-dependent hydrolase (beta-lactamase superfamily II)